MVVENLETSVGIIRNVYRYLFHITKQILFSAEI